MTRQTFTRSPCRCGLPTCYPCDLFARHPERFAGYVAPEPVPVREAVAVAVQVVAASPLPAPQRKKPCGCGTCADCPPPA